MDPTTRGRVILAIAASGLAASVWLVWPARHPAARVTVDGGAHVDASRIAANSKEHTARCRELEKSYRDAWESSAACTTDSDCVAETRGGPLTALDGCARFSNKLATHERADALAKQWLAEACAWALVANTDCGAPLVQCKDARCTEKPPPPLSSDWKRATLSGVVTLFMPADFTAVDTAAVDTYVRAFQGTKRSLTLELDPYADSGDAGRVQIIDGHAATVDATRVTFHERWTFGNVPDGHIVVRLECDTPAGCSDAAAIFGSIRVLLEPAR